MIYVDGVPLTTNSASSSRGNDILVALMEHPFLVSTSLALKAMPVRKISEVSTVERSSQSKLVYIFQREYATVDPSYVDAVGTDEATTCAGLVIRNRESGMTSIAHLDTPDSISAGLVQMLSLLEDHNSDAQLDVHVIGAFEDVSFHHENHSTKSKRHANGYSFALCYKIVEALAKRREKFHIQTFHILGHNTRWNSEGNAYPIFNGFLVETSNGNVIPATFDRTSRSPDEIVRRIRLTASFEDPEWTGGLLETYSTSTDSFIISPFSWTMRMLLNAQTLQKLSDQEVLLICSTSPSAEGPDFVDNLKRQWDYLIQHPDWRDTFPFKRPRIFERTEDGSWRRRLVD